MRLRPGEDAPRFETTTLDGRTFRLEEQRGGLLWLAFFRYAACPLCNLRVHEMIERRGTWEAAGLQVVLVFQSPAASIRRYVGRQAPPFAILPDPDERLYELYGLEKGLRAFGSPANLAPLARATARGFLPGAVEGTVTRIPADFLIDKEGRLADVFYGKIVADHIPFDRVRAFAAGAGEFTGPPT